ncbi:MAG: hypothetical protein KKB51_10725, partial [Candidatus Riflebacteria bacterium]|nr:hypothetical protein [Candidatus Riflebacteria bacterium]
ATFVSCCSQKTENHTTIPLFERDYNKQILRQQSLKVKPEFSIAACLLQHPKQTAGHQKNVELYF